MTAILRRELNSYFASPIAYVYLGLFTAFTGIIYFITVYSGLSSATYIFAYSFYFSMYLVPVLTMRLLTEERKQRTDQLLLTAPIHLFDIVAGKFLAAFAVYCAGMCSTVLEAFVLSFFCDFNWAVFWSSFIGIILLGGASIAICMFVSSMTENQIIAAVVGFVVMLILSMLDAFSSLFSSSVLQEVMLKLSFYVRYFDLTLGVLDFSDIFFFLSVTGVFLFLTTRVIDRRRWS
ncbi:MAG: ABC transporter permease [Oscillospiraceae bacterium]